MAATNYTVRIDKEDKQQAEQVFKSLGMTLATGINIYIKAVGRQRRVPFDLDLGEQSITTLMDTDKSRANRMNAFNALGGILSGHEVDLGKEREERIASK